MRQDFHDLIGCWCMDSYDLKKKNLKEEDVPLFCFFDDLLRSCWVLFATCLAFGFLLSSVCQATHLVLIGLLRKTRKFDQILQAFCSVLTNTGNS